MATIFDCESDCVLISMVAGFPNRSVQRPQIIWGVSGATGGLTAGGFMTEGTGINEIGGGAGVDTIGGITGATIGDVADSAIIGFKSLIFFGSRISTGKAVLAEEPLFEPDKNEVDVDTGALTFPIGSSDLGGAYVSGVGAPPCSNCGLLCSLVICKSCPR